MIIPNNNGPLFFMGSTIKRVQYKKLLRLNKKEKSYTILQDGKYNKIDKKFFNFRLKAQFI